MYINLTSNWKNDICELVVLRAHDAHDIALAYDRMHAAAVILLDQDVKVSKIRKCILVILVMRARMTQIQENVRDFWVGEV